MSKELKEQLRAEFYEKFPLPWELEEEHLDFWLAKLEAHTTTLLAKIEEELEEATRVFTAEIKTKEGRDPFDDSVITIPYDQEQAMKLGRKAGLDTAKSIIRGLME